MKRPEVVEDEEKAREELSSARKDLLKDVEEEIEDVQWKSDALKLMKRGIELEEQQVCVSRLYCRLFKHFVFVFYQYLVWCSV